MSRRSISRSIACWRGAGTRMPRAVDLAIRIASVSRAGRGTAPARKPGRGGVSARRARTMPKARRPGKGPTESGVRSQESGVRSGSSGGWACRFTAESAESAEGAQRVPVGRAYRRRASWPVICGHPVLFFSALPTSPWGSHGDPVIQRALATPARRSGRGGPGATVRARRAWRRGHWPVNAGQ